MDDLIQALNIFQKYLNNTNAYNPTHCEHDVMYVLDIDQNKVSDEDKIVLELLGFFWSDSEECFVSYRFGSG